MLSARKSETLDGRGRGMHYKVGLVWAASFMVMASGCAALKVASFQRDVYPIFEQNCVDCHMPPKGKGYRKTGLSLETYETLMHGTVYGPVIKPGDPKRSILLMLVEGRADASMRMPHQEDELLPAEQIAVLRRWVRQGALNN